MAYLGNTPQLSTMRTLVEGSAYQGQTEIPVPGGLTIGMNDVYVGGACLGTPDFDDTNGMSVKLKTAMSNGTQFKIVGWTPNQTVISGTGQLASFRNKIINGNFDIWQRGTSASGSSSGAFCADRWINAAIGSSSAISQQTFAPGQVQVPFEPKNFQRIVVTSVAGAGNVIDMFQRIESVRTLAGQPATLSFFARADAARPMAVDMQQNFGTGGSPSAPVDAIAATKVNLTNAWQKFTIQVTFPSILGKTVGTNGDDFLLVRFWFDAGSNFNANTQSLGQQSGTFDISGVQLEYGSVATNFEQRHVALELTLCQRYFQYYPVWKFWSTSVINAQPLGTVVPFDQMRIAPSVTYASTVYSNASGLVFEQVTNSAISYYTNSTGANLAVALTVNGVSLSSEL